MALSFFSSVGRLKAGRDVQVMRGDGEVDAVQKKVERYGEEVTSGPLI